MEKDQTHTRPSAQYSKGSGACKIYIPLCCRCWLTTAQERRSCRKAYGKTSWRAWQPLVASHRYDVWRLLSARCRWAMSRLLPHAMSLCVFHLYASFAGLAFAFGGKSAPQGLLSAVQEHVYLYRELSMHGSHIRAGGFTSL